jgi:hypothetical protein
VVDPSGRILVAGEVGSQLLLARFLPSGQPDLDFGVAGRVLNPFGEGGFPAKIALQPDGRILLAASPNSSPGGTTWLGRFIQSPLSVRVVAPPAPAIPPVGSPVSDEGTVMGTIPANDLLKDSRKRVSPFSDRRIPAAPRPRPVSAPPKRNPLRAVVLHR